LRPSVQVLCSFISLLLGSVSAQEATVRTHLDTTGEIWAGQKVTVVMEVLAPGYFASAVSFDLPDPQGVLLLPPAGHPGVAGETIEGVYYTVQRHELAAYPMHAGTLAVPSVKMHFEFKRAPLDTDTVSAVVQTAEISFTISAPPGAEHLGQVISARDLKIEEVWRPEPGSDPVKAGAAFTRTITFTAPEVPGMLFPPFDPGEIEGLRLYQKPEIRDQKDRGSLRGERRDIVTYLCQRPGMFVIPAARFVWFDLATRQLMTVDLPSRTLHVVADPAAVSTAHAEEVVKAPAHAWARRAWKWGAIAVLVAGVVGVVIYKAHQRGLLSRFARPFYPKHLAPLNANPLARRSR